MSLVVPSEFALDTEGTEGLPIVLTVLAVLIGTAAFTLHRCRRPSKVAVVQLPSGLKVCHGC